MILIRFLIERQHDHLNHTILGKFVNLKPSKSRKDEEEDSQEFSYYFPKLTTLSKGLMLNYNNTEFQSRNRRKYIYM